MKLGQAPELYYYIFNLFTDKTQLEIETVNRMFDKFLGIANEHSAAVFVINVT